MSASLMTTYGADDHDDAPAGGLHRRRRLARRLRHPRSSSGGFADLLRRAAGVDRGVRRRASACVMALLPAIVYAVTVGPLAGSGRPARRAVVRPDHGGARHHRLRVAPALDPSGPPAAGDVVPAARGGDAVLRHVTTWRAQAFHSAFLERLGFAGAPWLWAMPSTWFAAFVAVAAGEAPARGLAGVRRRGRAVRGLRAAGRGAALARLRAARRRDERGRGAGGAPAPDAAASRLRPRRGARRGAARERAVPVRSALPHGRPRHPAADRLLPPPGHARGRARGSVPRVESSRRPGRVLRGRVHPDDAARRA